MLMNITIISAYLFFLLVLSWHAGRRDTAEGFLLAGRNLNVWNAAATIVASKIGGGLILTTTVLAFAFGYSALFLFVGFIVGYLLFYFFALRLYWQSRHGNFYTLADYFAQNHGQLTGRLIAVLSAMSMFGWVLTNLIGGGKILSDISGLSFSVSVGVVAAAVGIYLMLAGFRAVVRTDIVQVAALFILLISLVTFIFAQGIEISATNTDQMPIFRILVFMVVGALFPLGSAELWERVYAARDLATVRRSLVCASLSYVLFGVVLIVVTLTIANLFPINDPATGFIVGLSSLIPESMSVLATIAFISAILSSADTFAFSTAAIISHNILAKSNTQAMERKVMARSIAVGVVILGAVLSILLGDILNVTIAFVSLTLGIASLSIVSWIFPKASSIVFVSGVSLLVSTLILTPFFVGFSELLPALSLLSAFIGVGLGWALMRVFQHVVERG